jgi:mRNA interferase HigB
MRVIAKGTIRRFQREQPHAAAWLDGWLSKVSSASWRSLADVRQEFPRTDSVNVGGRHLVYVFDVKGNTYRLLVGFDFDNQPEPIAFVKALLTHAEYAKNRWKEQLR